MNRATDISTVETIELNDEVFTRKEISVSVLRLDKIHPVVSGNKLFKLHYFLEEAERSGKQGLLSFGGAYSNHLVATAFAGRWAGFSTIGVVRGEKAESLSPTLLQCMEYGMQLHFISRSTYQNKETDQFQKELKSRFTNYLLIPEGGYHPLGARGSALIRRWINGKGYSHICLACGTATTIAGLLMEPEKGQRIIGIPVLKDLNDWSIRMDHLLGNGADMSSLDIWDGHHFGGYAKKNEVLVRFMNECWERYRLPLDFVYTAKMLHAVFEQAELGKFPSGSRILCLHTGGLQGNASLPVDTLLY